MAKAKRPKRIFLEFWGEEAHTIRSGIGLEGGGGLKGQKGTCKEKGRGAKNCFRI